ncbi:MAG: YdcF family protein [Bacteroidia bacterium]|nr:YdcF family protein [Bacteroidia bacterium]
MEIPKPIKIIFLIISLWVIGFLSFIITDGLTDSGTKADAIVIFGNKVNNDGTLSERLKARLDHGLKIYKDGRASKIIVSGGLGKEGFYEGDKMRDYLISKGVEPEIILTDNHGDNTEATVVNAIKSSKLNNFRSLLVVSQYYHISRSKMLFRKHDFRNIYSSGPKYFELRDFYSLLRELPAYYSSL